MIILIFTIILTGSGQKTQNAAANGAPSNSNQVQQNTGSYPMTINDDAGCTVTLQKKPEKIIALGTLLNALYDAGGKPIAIGEVMKKPG